MLPDLNIKTFCPSFLEPNMPPVQFHFRFFVKNFYTSLNAFMIGYVLHQTGQTISETARLTILRQIYSLK